MESAGSTNHVPQHNTSLCRGLYWSLYAIIVIVKPFGLGHSGIAERRVCTMCPRMKSVFDHVGCCSLGEINGATEQEVGLTQDLQLA